MRTRTAASITLNINPKVVCLPQIQAKCGMEAVCDDLMLMSMSDSSSSLMFPEQGESSADYLKGGSEHHQGEMSNGGWRYTLE